MCFWVELYMFFVLHDYQDINIILSVLIGLKRKVFAIPLLEAPGGHIPWKVERGCTPVITSFFRPVGASYQFTIKAPLMCPIFNLEKYGIFSLVLAKISALKTQIFQIVPKPYFSRKIRSLSLDPTFGILCGTHPPKKLSAPPWLEALKLALIMRTSHDSFLYGW